MNDFFRWERYAQEIHHSNQIFDYETKNALLISLILSARKNISPRAQHNRLEDQTVLTKATFRISNGAAFFWYELHHCKQRSRIINIQIVETSLKWSVPWFFKPMHDLEKTYAEKKTPKTHHIRSRLMSSMVGSGQFHFWNFNRIVRYARIFLCVLSFIHEHLQNTNHTKYFEIYIFQMMINNLIITFK